MIATASLERALAYAGGSHSLTDIEAGIADGTFQLWEGERSVIVTEIRRTPGYTFLLFFLAGGNLRELEAMTPPILAWGQSVGCTKAQFVGRHGWQRTWLARDGWRAQAVMMERELP